MCLAQCLVKRPILLNVDSCFEGGGASGMLLICWSRAYKAGAWNGWLMPTFGEDYIAPVFTGDKHLAIQLKQPHSMAETDGGLLVVAKASRDRQGMHNK